MIDSDKDITMHVIIRIKQCNGTEAPYAVLLLHLRVVVVVDMFRFHRCICVVTHMRALS